MRSVAKAGITGLLLWLGGIGVFILCADTFFNVHSSSFWLFLVPVVWIVGVPIALSLWLQKLHKRQESR